MANVVDSLVWDRDAGVITYNGVRYLLIRPETLAAWQEGMEREDPGAGEAIFSGGLAGGRLSGRGFARQMGLTQQQMLEFMAEMGNQIGWGRFVLEDLSDGKLTLQVHNSPFAAYHGPAEHGVCHLIRGVFAGVAEAVFDGPVTAGEEQCLSKGDPYCRFVFEKAPPK